MYMFFFILSEPISEVWRSRPVNRHYFQNISLVEKRWKLFRLSSASALSLCVVAAWRQRNVILCCCETTFLIIEDLTYSLTYQIIISLIPLTPDFVYTHFAQKIRWTVKWCMFTLHFLHSICKACDNLRMRGRTSKSARNILNDVRTSTLGSFTLTFAWNRNCRIGFPKPIFTPFKNGKLASFSCVQTSRVMRFNEQFHWSHLCARRAAVCRNQSVKVYHRSSSPLCSQPGRQ